MNHPRAIDAGSSGYPTAQHLESGAKWMSWAKGSRNNILVVCRIKMTDKPVCARYTYWKDIVIYAMFMRSLCDIYVIYIHGTFEQNRNMFWHQLRDVTSKPDWLGLSSKNPQLFANPGVLHGFLGSLFQKNVKQGWRREGRQWPVGPPVLQNNSLLVSV